MGDSVRKQAEENLGNIDTLLATALATALGTPSQHGGIGVPKADHTTEAGGAWKVVAIPAGTKYLDFLLDIAAYVVANATATTPFGSNNGVPYQPNLNFRLPCTGCTYLHLKAASAAIATMKWNTIA